MEGATERQKLSERRKRQYLRRGSVIASYAGRCPKCDMMFNPGEYITKDPETEKWGHAECINVVMHFNEGGGHPLCGTRWSSVTQADTDWSKVTCKRCLKRRTTN